MRIRFSSLVAFFCLHRAFTAALVRRTPLRFLHRQPCTTALACKDDSGALSTTGDSIVTGVTLKVAVDSQGAVYDLDETKSERFTGPQALDMVHRLRCGSDAVLVGRYTVQVDNPSLNVRRVECEKHPLRVILDSRLSLLQEREQEDGEYIVFTDGLPTVVYHCVQDVDRESLRVADNVDLVQLPAVEHGGGLYVSPPAVLSHLSHTYHVDHLMIEGGPATAKLFLDGGLVDRLILVHATSVTFRKPLLMDLSPDVLTNAGLIRLGDDFLGGDAVEYWARPNFSWPTKDLKAWP